MLAQERLLRITEMLNDHETGMVSVSELSEWLGVSTMTVRRDLDRLESMAILRRIRGGAVAYPQRRWDSYSKRDGRYNREKRAVGWAAAQLVNPGDRILLDSGTTTAHLARNLNLTSNVVVVTHSIPAANELARLPKVTTVLLGGTLHHTEQYTYGPEALRSLGQVSVDRFFLSAAGYDLDTGINDPYPHDVTMKQAMMKASRQIVLVADSSKWGKKTGSTIAQFGGIHTLVVDDGVAPEAVAAFEAEGVEVVTPSHIRFRTIYREVWEDSTVEDSRRL